MRKKRLKRIFVITMAMLLGVGLYLNFLYKTWVEFPRMLGFLNDDYQNLSLEESVERANTWEDCEKYLMGHLRFDERQASLDAETIHKTQKAVCFGAASIAEELLKNNADAYECQLAVFRQSGREAIHVVCLVRDKRTGKYGSLGIYAGDCIMPKHGTGEEVTEKIKKRFFWEQGISVSLINH